MGCFVCRFCPLSILVSCIWLISDRNHTEFTMVSDWFGPVPYMCIKTKQTASTAPHGVPYICHLTIC